MNQKIQRPKISSSGLINRAQTRNKQLDGNIANKHRQKSLEGESPISNSLKHRRAGEITLKNTTSPIPTIAQDPTSSGFSLSDFNFSQRTARTFHESSPCILNPTRHAQELQSQHFQDIQLSSQQDLPLEEKIRRTTNLIEQSINQSRRIFMPGQVNSQHQASNIFSPNYSQRQIINSGGINGLPDPFAQSPGTNASNLFFNSGQPENHLGHPPTAEDLVNTGRFQKMLNSQYDLVTLQLKKSKQLQNEIPVSTHARPSTSYQDSAPRVSDPLEHTRFTHGDFSPSDAIPVGSSRVRDDFPRKVEKVTQSSKKTSNQPQEGLRLSKSSKILDDSTKENCKITGNTSKADHCPPKIFQGTENRFLRMKRDSKQLNHLQEDRIGMIKTEISGCYDRDILSCQKITDLTGQKIMFRTLQDHRIEQLLDYEDSKAQKSASKQRAMGLKRHSIMPNMAQAFQTKAVSNSRDKPFKRNQNKQQHRSKDTDQTEGQNLAENPRKNSKPEKGLQKKKTNFIQRNLSLQGQGNFSRSQEGRSRSNSIKKAQSHNLKQQKRSQQARASESAVSKEYQNPEKKDKASIFEHNDFRSLISGDSNSNKIPPKMPGELSSDISNIKVSQMSQVSEMIATLSDEVNRRNHRISGINYEHKVDKMKQSLVDSGYKSVVSVKEILSAEQSHLKNANLSTLHHSKLEKVHLGPNQDIGLQTHHKKKDTILSNLKTSEKSTAVDLSLISRSSFESFKLKDLTPSKPDLQTLEVPQFLNFFHIHFDSVPMNRPLDPFSRHLADKIVLFELDSEIARCAEISSPFKQGPRSQSDEVIEEEINYTQRNLGSEEARFQPTQSIIVDFDSPDSAETLEAKIGCNKFAITEDFRAVARGIQDRKIGTKLIGNSEKKQSTFDSNGARRKLREKISEKKPIFETSKESSKKRAKKSTLNSSKKQKITLSELKVTSGYFNSRLKEKPNQRKSSLRDLCETKALQGRINSAPKMLSSKNQDRSRSSSIQGTVSDQQTNIGKNLQDFQRLLRNELQSPNLDLPSLPQPVNQTSKIQHRNQIVDNVDSLSDSDSDIRNLEADHIPDLKSSNIQTAQTIEKSRSSNSPKKAQKGINDNHKFAAKKINSQAWSPSNQTRLRIMSKDSSRTLNRVRALPITDDNLPKNMLGFTPNDEDDQEDKDAISEIRQVKNRQKELQVGDSSSLIRNIEIDEPKESILLREVRFSSGQIPQIPNNQKNPFAETSLSIYKKHENLKQKFRNKQPTDDRNKNLINAGKKGSMRKISEEQPNTQNKYQTAFKALVLKHEEVKPSQPQKVTEKVKEDIDILERDSSSGNHGKLFIQNNPLVLSYAHNSNRTSLQKSAGISDSTRFKKSMQNIQFGSSIEQYSKRVDLYDNIDFLDQHLGGQYNRSLKNSLAHNQGSMDYRNHHFIESSGQVLLPLIAKQDEYLMPDSLKVSTEQNIDENRYSQDNNSNLQLSCNVLLHNHQSVQRDSENQYQDSDFGLYEVQTNLESLNSPKNPPLEQFDYFRDPEQKTSNRNGKQSSRNSQPKLEISAPKARKISNLSQGTKSSPNIENVPMSDFKTKHSIAQEMSRILPQTILIETGPNTITQGYETELDQTTDQKRKFDCSESEEHENQRLFESEPLELDSLDLLNNMLKKGEFKIKLQPSYPLTELADKDPKLVEFLETKHTFIKSKTKFNRGMEFNYRFSRSAVAKRIQALHGYGLEAIHEDLDLENEKTVFTNQSYEFDQNSTRGFRDHLEYSQLLRSQEEPQVDIEKLRSSMNSVLRESKEFPSIIPRSASPKNVVPTKQSTKLLVNMTVIEEFDCRDINSESKSSFNGSFKIQQNLSPLATPDDVKLKAAFIEEEHKFEKKNVKRQYEVDEIMNSAKKKTIFRTAEKIKIVGERTPVKSLAREKNSNSHKDLSRSPLEEKLDEGVLRKYQRGGPESKKLDFGTEHPLIQSVNINQNLESQRKKIAVVPELALPKISNQINTIEGRSSERNGTASKNSSMVSESDYCSSKSQDELCFYLKKSSRSVANMKQKYVPLISLHYSNDQNQLMVPILVQHMDPEVKLDFSLGNSQAKIVFKDQKKEKPINYIISDSVRSSVY